VSDLTCNPGRWLQFDGDLELDGNDTVVDRDSEHVVTLAQLLQAFRADLADDHLGRLRITVGPAE
jgi:hypothetical protein